MKRSHTDRGSAHHDTHHGQKAHKRFGYAATKHPMSGEHKSKAVHEKFGSGMGHPVKDHKTQ